MKILVKDYGGEGIKVRGITDDDAIAITWEAGDSSNRCINVELEDAVSGSDIPLAERL